MINKAYEALAQCSSQSAATWLHIWKCNMILRHSSLELIMISEFYTTSVSEHCTQSSNTVVTNFTSFFRTVVNIFMFTFSATAETIKVLQYILIMSLQKRQRSERSYSLKSAHVQYCTRAHLRDGESWGRHSCLWHVRFNCWWRGRHRCPRGKMGLSLCGEVGAVVCGMLGWTVGCEVGAAVGVKIDLNVGDEVGAAVGKKVGVRVGLLVGCIVGACVGAGVGRKHCFAVVAVGQTLHDNWANKTRPHVLGEKGTHSVWPWPGWDVPTWLLSILRVMTEWT